VPSPVISIEGVSETFPGVRALGDVRLELMPGEARALMGENGASKSMLMKILAGIYAKDSGTILYNGEQVAFTNPRNAREAGIGIIHQELPLMNLLTVAQNIFIGREPRQAFGRQEVKNR
jgi:ribose transport system ATP-binding protein